MAQPLQGLDRAGDRQVEPLDRLDQLGPTHKAGPGVGSLEIGHSLHLSDVKLPTGVKTLAREDATLVTIVPPSGYAEEQKAAAAAAAGGAAPGAAAAPAAGAAAPAAGAAAPAAAAKAPAGGDKKK